MRGAQGDGYSASAASELGFGREGEGALERFFMVRMGIEVSTTRHQDSQIQQMQKSTRHTC